MGKNSLPPTALTFHYLWISEMTKFTLIATTISVRKTWAN